MVIRLSERIRFKMNAKTINGVCEFEADKSIKYGGLAIFNRDTHTIEDKTIDKLQEEKNGLL